MANPLVNVKRATHGFGGIVRGVANDLNVLLPTLAEHARGLRARAGALARNVIHLERAPAEPPGTDDEGEGEGVIAYDQPAG